MNNRIKYGMIFIGSAFTGAVISWFFTKKHYEFIVEAEIESARETYNTLAKNLAEKNQKLKDATDLSNVTKSVNYTMTGYYPTCWTNEEDLGVNISDDISEAVIELNTVLPATDAEHPYTIAPEEFGNQDDYDLLTFTYYADKVLTDDGDDPIDPKDIDKIIGEDSLSTFGEYDDYAVYVRNDKRKCDYEILLSEDPFYIKEKVDEEVQDY